MILLIMIDDITLTNKNDDLGHH